MGKLGLALVLSLGVLLAAADAAAATVHGVPLPPGSRSVDVDLFASGRGFRKTVAHVERFLRRRGLRHRAVPVYRYRGVVVARFLSRHESSKWQAIHVFRAAGRTRIAIVPRPAPLTEGADRGKSSRSEDS